MRLIGLVRVMCYYARAFTCRCAETYGNYLGYARIGSLLARESDEVFDAKVLGRAKVDRAHWGVLPRLPMWAWCGRWRLRSASCGHRDPSGLLKDQCCAE